METEQERIDKLKAHNIAILTAAGKFIIMNRDLAKDVMRDLDAPSDELALDAVRVCLSLLAGLTIRLEESGDVREAKPPLNS